MNDSPLAGPEWAGFLTSMRFRGDDTDFLVAADWLQDQPGPEFEAWAEFVRCQVAVTAADRAGPRTHVYTDSCDCERCRPERRAALLYDRWGVCWLAHSLPRVEGVRYEAATLSDFACGFPREAKADVKDFNVARAIDQVRAIWGRAPLAASRLRLFEPKLHPLFWWLDVNRNAALGQVVARLKVDVVLRIRNPPPERLPIASDPVSACRKMRPTNHLDTIGEAVHDVLARRASVLDGFLEPIPDLAPAPDLGGES
jgi:hypothetical protein